MVASDSEYFLVRSEVLPEVFLKVMEVKRLLSSGNAASVNEAVRLVGLSRSAYYKYRDSILPFYEISAGYVVTLTLVVENLPGVLASILACFAEHKANVLTINQGIPINGLADLSVSLETREMNSTLSDLMHHLGRITGVRSHRILAREDDRS